MPKLTIDQFREDSGKTLNEAVESYFLHKRAAGHSPSSIKQYKWALRGLTDWLEAHKIASPADIRPDHLRLYMETVKQRGLASSTVFSHFKCIHAWLTFLHSEEEIPTNPIQKVTAPKVIKRIHPALTQDELRRLDTHLAGKSVFKIRDRAIFLLMLDTCLRRFEVADIRNRDIRDDGTILVLGKGGKERIVKMGPHTLAAVRKWMRVRGGKPDDWLWVGKHGPLTKWGLTIRFEQISRQTGIHLHAHKIRRTGALLMYRSGMSLFTLQTILGHASPETTRIYLDIREEDICREHDMHSPVESLKRQRGSMPKNRQSM